MLIKDFTQKMLNLYLVFTTIASVYYEHYTFLVTLCIVKYMIYYHYKGLYEERLQRALSYVPRIVFKNVASRQVAPVPRDAELQLLVHLVYV